MKVSRRQVVATATRCTARRPGWQASQSSSYGPSSISIWKRAVAPQRADVAQRIRLNTRRTPMMREIQRGPLNSREDIAEIGGSRPLVSADSRQHANHVGISRQNGMPAAEEEKPLARLSGQVGQ